MTVALVQVVVMKVLRSCPMLDLAGYAYRKGVQYECEKKKQIKDSAWFRVRVPGRTESPFTTKEKTQLGEYQKCESRTETLTRRPWGYFKSSVESQSGV